MGLCSEYSAVLCYTGEVTECRGCNIRGETARVIVFEGYVVGYLHIVYLKHLRHRTCQ